MAPPKRKGGFPRRPHRRTQPGYIPSWVELEREKLSPEELEQVEDMSPESFAIWLQKRRRRDAL
jgi:hypothetical protein